MKKIITTSNAPAAIGAYSQAIEINGMLFTSGQLGLDPVTGEFNADDIAGQTEQVIKNLQAILQEAGFELSDVVKTTCFLANIGDFAGFNAVYARYFSGKPARSCVAAAALPKNALVEVEVIAAKG